MSLVCLVKLEDKVHLDHRVYLVSREVMVSEDLKVNEGHLVCKVCLVWRGQKDLQGLMDHLDHKVLLDQMDLLVIVALLACLDQLDLLAQEGPKAPKVSVEILVNLGKKYQQGHLDSKDHLVHLDREESVVRRGHLVNQDPLGLEEGQETRDLQDQLV